MDHEVEINSDESPTALNPEMHVPAITIGAGEISVEFDDEKKEKCEGILPNMCTDLLKNWDARMRTTKLQKAAEVVFTGDANIDQTLLSTSDEKAKLQELISSIPGSSKKEFTPEQIWEAFYKNNKDNP